MIGALDHSLYGSVASSSGLDGAALFLAVALARWAILLGPALLAGLWLAGRAEGKRAAVAAALAALLAVGVAAVLSSLMFEPRPFMEGLAPNRLHHSADSGFPSDHATALFALSFALWLQPPRRAPKVWILAMGLALGVGWARVFLGVHFPIDVAGGAIIGGVAAVVVGSRWGRSTTDRVADLLERWEERLLATVRPRPRH